MFLLSAKRIKFLTAFITISLLHCYQPALAAGPPEPSIFTNPMALALLLVMALLLIIIGVLSAVLVGAADIKIEQKKKNGEIKQKVLPMIMLAVLLTSSGILQAQDEAPVEKVKTVSTIAGLQPSVFYLMNGVILLEFLIILALLVNIRLLIKKEKEKLTGLSPEAITELKRNKISWWGKMNKFKPASQEADLVMDHEYDGIRELDNSLPPWWLYGFYATILFAIIYLWRYHVSHTAPSSIEEYTASVTKAQLETQEYLKKKGDAVDENTVVYLPGADDLAEGKSIFQKSCASCHKESGAGDVGPNLTDDYWMHGNDMKSVFKTIRYGINAMPQWQNTYSNKQIAQVASYVKSLHGTNPASPKAPQGALMKEDAPATADSTKATADVKQ
jgi:cytochrome c oxidase cbb3-type subunit 3